MICLFHLKYYFDHRDKERANFVTMVLLCVLFQGFWVPSLQETRNLLDDGGSDMDNTDWQECDRCHSRF